MHTQTCTFDLPQHAHVHVPCVDKGECRASGAKMRLRILDDGSSVPLTRIPCVDVLIEGNTAVKHHLHRSDLQWCARARQAWNFVNAPGVRRCHSVEHTCFMVWAHARTSRLSRTSYGAHIKKLGPRSDMGILS